MTHDEVLGAYRAGRGSAGRRADDAFERVTADSDRAISDTHAIRIADCNGNALERARNGGVDCDDDAADSNSDQSPRAHATTDAYANPLLLGASDEPVRSVEPDADRDSVADTDADIDTRSVRDAGPIGSLAAILLA